MSFPDKKYSVILADPPWWYSNRKTGGERKNKTKFGGGARKHYPLVKDKHLKRYAKFFSDKLTGENQALFMWATAPRLDFAIECLKLAGFRYVTVVFTWIKYRKDFIQPIYGPGHYTASNAEYVLLGIRGKMKPVKRMLPSIIRHPRMEHSRKPDIHHLIDTMYPNGTRIELFSRRSIEGWSNWGNHF